MDYKYVRGLDENIAIESVAFLTLILFSLFANDIRQRFDRADSIQSGNGHDFCVMSR